MTEHLIQCRNCKTINRYIPGEPYAECAHPHLVTEYQIAQKLITPSPGSSILAAELYPHYTEYCNDHQLLFLGPTQYASINYEKYPRTDIGRQPAFSGLARTHPPRHA